MAADWRRSTSRLRRTNTGRMAVYGTAVAAMAAVVVVLAVVGAGTDLLLGATGIILSLLIFLVQEGGFLRPRRKKIVFVGKSNSAFSVNILNGLKDTLSPTIPADLDTVLPNARHEKDDLAFQVGCLRRSAVQEADALVIVPTGDHESLCQELRRLTRKGLFIVAIDYKVPNRFFYENQLRLPRFVTSDFRAGGRLAAALIAETMRESRAEKAIVLMGPTSSTPGSMRSQSCVYELARRGLLSSVIGQELETWDEEEAIAKFVTAVDRLRSQGDGVSTVCVFCANDANCLAIDEFISSHPELTTDLDYVLVGYDGVRRSDDELAVALAKRCVGTVDVLPRSQGRSAGAFLVEEYEGRTSDSAKNAVIVPKLIRQASWRRGG